MFGRNGGGQKVFGEFIEGVADLGAPTAAVVKAAGKKAEREGFYKIQ